MKSRAFRPLRARWLYWARTSLLILVALQPASRFLIADDTAGASASPAAAQVETIVCIRHGEKPPGGLGNLDTQGLNRALALPGVLIADYGRPAYIFAPDPTVDKATEGPPSADGKTKEDVSYVRPLITIAPTAIECGLPINATFGFRHITDLEAELDKPRYRNAVVFVAWEHVEAEQFMRNEVRDHGGNPDAVPEWAHGDFDSIYVARIRRDEKGGASVAFQVDHEGLDGLSADAPSPAAKKP